MRERYKEISIGQSLIQFNAIVNPYVQCSREWYVIVTEATTQTIIEYE